MNEIEKEQLADKILDLLERYIEAKFKCMVIDSTDNMSDNVSFFFEIRDIIRKELIESL